MAISVACREDTPFVTAGVVAAAEEGVLPEIVRALGVKLDAETDICRTWGVDPLGAVENEAVTSDIPTLVLSGAWDPATPPSYARLAARTLSNSHVVEFPATGHGVLTSRTSCALAIVAAFLDDPLSRPDGGCAAQIGPPAFVVP